MSRSRLSLFEVDEAALSAFGVDLRAALASEDRARVVGLLELTGGTADYLRAAPRAVDVFLAAEGYAPSTPIFDALRRAATSRALRLAWTSESLALEGRLRGFEPLRDEEGLARTVDTLLGGRGVPWYLRRPGDTCGVLRGAEKDGLMEGIEALPDPPPELIAFAQGLGTVEGTVLCHDTLL